MNTNGIALISIVLLANLVALPISAFITMSLWNFVVSPLLGLTLINFWQALGLSALLSFVGSFFKK